MHDARGPGGHADDRSGALAGGADLYPQRAPGQPAGTHRVGASLAALAACGVKISPFNLPEWDETPAGLQTLLHSLFRVTPPTALVVMRPTWATGVLSFLATRGLRVPQQVSVVGYGLEALNPWHVPALAYLCAEDLPVVRRTVRWVRQVARGVVSPRRYAYPGLFVDGPSLGPAPG
ncbi:MAG: substrate-binding domain-containing protein [Kiritimatiellia bacterium]